MRKAAACVAAIIGAIGLWGAVAQPVETLVPNPKAKVAETPTLPVAAASAGARELNATDVNAWLDGYMPYAIARGDIPGAVVVVVKDGQILTQRGFGFANTAKNQKVDPATTLFRPGSISKLFTWTAVMQQVEQGKLNLDADVNQYLDFKIPPFEGKPITVRRGSAKTRANTWRLERRPKN